MSGRRDFLRGLVSLPLIGGGVSLIGQPSAVALPATKQLLFEYHEWLAWEHVAVCQARDHGWAGNRGYLEQHSAYHVAQHLHGPGPRCEHYEGTNAGLRSHANRWHHGAPAASTRAALVLSTVGCDWRGVVEIATMAVKVWRVRRLLAKAKRHQDASNRFGAKAVRIMPELKG